MAVRTPSSRRGESSKKNSASEFAESLGEIRQRAGKIVRGYALAGDLDVRGIRCNDVAIEWPPRSGRTMHFPEIDRAAWFALPLARETILASQRPFLDRLETLSNNTSRRDRRKT